MTEITEDISDIQGLTEESRELLEATGVESLKALAESDAHILFSEMEQANAMLQLTPTSPAASEIQLWIEQSRNLLDYHPAVEVRRLEPVEEEAEKVASEILHAIAVPVAHMVKQKISVKDIPAMNSFVEEEESVSQKVEVPEASQDLSRSAELLPEQDAQKVAPPRVVHIKPKAREAVETKPILPRDRDKTPIQPLVSDNANIRKAPSTGLNAGKTPHSRGYIRGVLHPQPIRIRIAAILTIITMIMLPASMVSGVLLLLSYPVWIAWIPLGFVVMGLLYFMFARGMSCRICGQPIYGTKACRKHVKAHHIKFLGYIFPTCFHVLLFSWFRCIYCGTSVRVKE
ncbi:MAG: DUF4332 domain-containing protein [Akkermansiaceae bacterium]|nr:DUF4332 domain-containing protein [Akkermansiaceae bacterium]